MRLAVVGYGRMGRMVESAGLARGHEVVARVDSGEALRRELTLPSPLGGAEVAVEFTSPEAAPENILTLAGAGVPVVSGSTGWGGRWEEVVRGVEREAHRGAALLHAPNFSIGVQLFFRLARELGRLVERVPELDLHLTEIHHRHKVDHPSGTARRVAEILLEELTRKEGWFEGPVVGGSDPALLEVTSVRVGENPGTHIIGVEGPDERIELRHEARSRMGFARGAVEAAEWLRGRQGVHSPGEWLGERFGGRG